MAATAIFKVKIGNRGHRFLSCMYFFSHRQMCSIAIMTWFNSCVIVLRDASCRHPDDHNDFDVIEEDSEWVFFKRNNLCQNQYSQSLQTFQGRLFVWRLWWLSESWPLCRASWVLLLQRRTTQGGLWPELAFVQALHCVFSARHEACLSGQRLAQSRSRPRMGRRLSTWQDHRRGDGWRE